MPHIEHLLADYHDQELTPKQVQQVEAHLAECAQCRSKLTELQELHELLAWDVLPDTFSSPKVFKSQVLLRISQRERDTSDKRAWLWYLVPLFMGGGLILAQALVALSVILLTVLGWGGVEAILSFVPSLQSFLSGLFLTSWLRMLTLVVSVALNLVLLVALIPYVGWVGFLWRSNASHQKSSLNS